MLKIGVILKGEEEITSLIDATKAAIYEKDAETNIWKKTDEVNECFRQRESIHQMREFLSQLTLDLKDCKILVASILTGVPFMILDKEGFMLCEADQLSNRLFEEIEADYKKMKQNQEQGSEIPVKDYPAEPFETSIKGVYELDLRELLKFHPEITSKKAMIPFLKEVKFTKLIILCSHVMPWLDRELKGYGYKYLVNKIEEQGYQIEIMSILN